MFIAYLLPVIAFAMLADEVGEGSTLPLDTAILQSVHSLHNVSLDWLALHATELGSIWWVGGVTAILFGLFLYRRQFTSAVIIAGGVGGSMAINLILKALFQRDRPQLWERIVTENSYSFPSGHAMASAALAISIIVILWPTRWRWWAVAVGALYMIAIAFTRLYLGVHYPTDIIAGWLMAGAWVVLLAAVVRNWHFTKQS